MFKYLILVNKIEIGVSYNLKRQQIKIGGFTRNIAEVDSIKEFFIKENVVYSFSAVNKGYYHFMVHPLEFKTIIKEITKKYNCKQVDSLGRLLG